MVIQICQYSAKTHVLSSYHSAQNATRAHLNIGRQPMDCSWRIRGGRQMLFSIRCSDDKPTHQTLRTCKNCKTQFDPLLNHPRACRYHTAHFGGETKRKFESVYSGGTMNTPGSGQVFQYWHCCGSEDPFDPGCMAAPHFSYDE